MCMECTPFSTSERNKKIIEFMCFFRRQMVKGAGNSNFLLLKNCWLSTKFKNFYAGSANHSLFAAKRT